MRCGLSITGLGEDLAGSLSAQSLRNTKKKYPPAIAARLKTSVPLVGYDLKTGGVMGCQYFRGPYEFLKSERFPMNRSK